LSIDKSGCLSDETFKSYSAILEFYMNQDNKSPDNKAQPQQGGPSGQQGQQPSRKPGQQSQQNQNPGQKSEQPTPGQNADKK
jgi:hypothetical protein